MRTYFFSGHISVLATNQITREFSGLVNGTSAFSAYNEAVKRETSLLQIKMQQHSHAIVMDAFNLVEVV